ncbi:MAG: ATP-binding protein [Lachnospiraceae bacterium]|nr:ATP-binding protein [Lachnospiraceae bacterium]
MPLTNEQYDAIMRDYNARTLENEDFVRTRKKKLYESIPKLDAIDREISSQSIAAAKRMMREKSEGLLQELHQQIAALTAEKERLIEEAGFDRDYLTPPYRCKDCKDTGFVKGKRCHCFSQAAIDMVYAQSHMKERLKDHNFNTYSFDYYSADDIDVKTKLSARQYAERAFDTAKKFIQTFDTEHGNLLIYGKTGTGKTFLSDCIAKELIDSGHTVIYLTAFSMFDILKKGMFAKDGKQPAEYGNLLEHELLIIDDLGTEFSNSMTNAQLFAVLNERLIRKRSTIISTNLRMDEISEIYTGRIFSRFMEHYTFIHTFGQDIRMKKKFA